MSQVFVDTNVFLRYLTGDVPEQTERAKTFLQGSIEKGEPRLAVSEVVILELHWTLNRTYKLNFRQRTEKLLPIIEFTEQIYPASGFNWRAVFKAEQEGSVDFNDALHYHLMLQEGISAIVSFDDDFDKLPGIQRQEP